MLTTRRFTDMMAFPGPPWWSRDDARRQTVRRATAGWGLYGDTLHYEAVSRRILSAFSDPQPVGSEAVVGDGDGDV
jgi:hypothetical protein